MRNSTPPVCTGTRTPTRHIRRHRAGRLRTWPSRSCPTMRSSKSACWMAWVTCWGCRPCASTLPRRRTPETARAPAWRERLRTWCRRRGLFSSGPSHDDSSVALLHRPALVSSPPRRRMRKGRAVDRACPQEISVFPALGVEWRDYDVGWWCCCASGFRGRASGSAGVAMLWRCFGVGLV